MPHEPVPDRRRFLDIVMSQADPHYLKGLQRYQKVVQQRNQLLRMLQDGGAAEEVTQDTSFNIWNRASSFRPERGKVTAWLFSIGHNRTIDEHRRRRRRQEKLVYQDISLVNQPADEHGDPALYPARQM